MIYLFLIIKSDETFASSLVMKWNLMIGNLNWKSKSRWLLHVHWLFHNVTTIFHVLWSCYLSFSVNQNLHQFFIIQQTSVANTLNKSCSTLIWFEKHLLNAIIFFCRTQQIKSTFLLTFFSFFLKQPSLKNGHYFVFQYSKIDWLYFKQLGIIFHIYLTL